MRDSRKDKQSKDPCGIKKRGLSLDGCTPIGYSYVFPLYDRWSYHKSLDHFGLSENREV